jgi:hypothetical protein
MEIKQYHQNGTSYIDAEGRIDFTMDSLPELERGHLVKYMAKRNATLIEVYYLRTLNFSPGYFRAAIRMPDGEIRRIWHDHEHQDLHPKWKWDGEKGKRKREEYEAQHIDWSEYDQNGGTLNRNK